jgi:hypothetical protein
MTDWVKDLEGLLGTIVGPENSPVDELMAGNWGGAATAPLTAAFNVAQAPLEFVQNDLVAPLMGYEAGLQNKLGLGTDTTRRREQLLLQGQEGQIWDEWVEDKPAPIKVALELGMDPTNFVGMGIARGAASQLRHAADIPDLAKRAGDLRGTASVLEAGDLLLNQLPGRAVSRAAKSGPATAIGGAAKRGIERVVPNAFELSPKTRLERKIVDIVGAKRAERATRNQSVWGRNLPVPWAGPGKSLAPIDEYSVPPYFDNSFDEGVPKRVRQLAYEAHQRLAAKNMTTDPEIPGVTTPGMSRAFGPTATGFPRVTGKPAFLDRIPPDIRAKMFDPRLGFVNIPKGGYLDPNDVDIDEENIQDMAIMGLQAMLDFDNQNSNKMFSAILRSGPGMQLVKNRIIAKYGPGIEPYIPVMYEQFRAALAEEGVSLGESGARFLTAWGFPEGNIPTKRLEKIQRQLDLGQLKPEQAFEKVIDAVAKASPEAIETAAAMGAGFESAYRNIDQDDLISPWHGDMAPGISEGGRPIIPDAFNQHLAKTSQFADNRAAYDKYMRQLFGNLTDQELDTLRRISVELLYDEMMNAATEVGGGANAAVKLAQKGPEGTYSGDTQTKISPYPSGPQEVGARQVPEDIPGGSHRQPSIKQLNIREAEEALGRSLTATEKRRTNAQIVQMVEEAGGTPWLPNAKGGPLANVQRILDAYNSGKDIPVGDTVAKDWYTNAVKEVEQIVGPGRYEDAMMLIELMAVTSSGTGVERNADNALKAFAEWKLGSDDAIRNRLGLTKEQADTILNSGERWNKIEAVVDPETGKKVMPELSGDEYFKGSMDANQQRAAGNLFGEYIRRRSAVDPTWDLSQGGPKTHNFAGSFIIKVWDDAIQYALGEKNPELAQKIRAALSDAATIYTVDRHIARVSNLPTAVTDTGAILEREKGILAAREISERPEDIQSGAWYWAKDQQGFLRVNRTDDMAVALRRAWNKRKDPAMDAAVREGLRAENPGLSDEAIREMADDIMRQEVVMSYINKALGKNRNAIDKAFGTRNPASALFGAGNDVLGIMHRAGKGVMPTTPLSRKVLDIAIAAERELAQVKAGQSFGATYKYDGQGIVPDDAKSGFAVSITSAGKTLSTSKTKTSERAIERFLAKFGESLDDPTVSRHIRFGVFPMEGGASFDVGIIVPDESTAADIGKRFNQQSMYNLATGDIIDLGGTGKPVEVSGEDLRSVIESVFGKVPAGTRDPDEVRRTGATIDEMDEVNPISIFSRRVVQPLMSEYRRNSVASLQTKDVPSVSEGVLVPQPDDTAPFDFGEIYQSPLLSTQENMILSERVDGMSVSEKLDQFYQEAEKDIAALDAAGLKWGPHTELEDRLKMTDDESLKKMIRKYADEGVDIRYATPEDIEAHRLRRMLAKAEGIDFDRQTTWDLIRAAWGEQALFSPKYHLGNIQGAWLQNAFGGTWRAGTPREFLSALKLVRGGLDDVESKEVMNSLYVGRIAQRWGYDEIPPYLLKGGVRSMTGQSRTARSATGELVGRATKNRRLAQAVSKPFEYNADMSQAVETVMRGALWGDVMEREMSAAMRLIEDQVAQMAHKQGLESFEWSQLDRINMVPGGPSAKRLKDHLMNMGFSEGYAERAGRNFAEAKNKAENLARAEVNKRQFSYDRTNLDEFVGKFIPFHYWYSRAVRYYGEEAIRHPYIILNYMRANDGIEDAQNDPGLSARQKGFLRLMGTPLGFTLLMNPDSLFGVVKIFGIDTSFEPSGETEAGGVVRWAKEHGLGLYPWIDGTLNLMGVYGDTFEPDLLGIRHKTLIGATVNFMRSQLGMDPAAAPYQTAMGQARWNVSSFVSQFAPDWFSQPVLPKAGGNTTEATMDTIIESRVIQISAEEGKQLTNAELLEIMTDDQNPTYLRAFQDVAKAGFLQQLLNFTAPQNYRIREASRDVRSAQVATIWEAAEKAGVTPTEFKPTEGDITFAAKYKNLTGKEWKPGDYEEALALQDLTKATNEHKPFVVQEQEFYNLGTPKQQRVFEKYNAIKNGTDPQTISLDEETRREIAENWAYKLGYSGDIQEVYSLRETYEREHPVFGEFRGWQDQMYNLSNQLGGTLAEYRRMASEQNPNAARYFQEMIADVHATQPQDKWEKEIERRTTNAAAWLAITGQPTNRYDAGPTPGSVPGDITLATTTPVGQESGFNPDYDWMASLQQIPQGYGMNSRGTYWNQ